MMNRKTFMLIPFLLLLTLAGCAQEPAKSAPDLPIYKTETQVYSTKGHPKAKGVDWQIKVPAGWVVEETNSPNMVQKIINRAPTGRQAISLMIQQDAHLAKLSFSEKELQKLFQETGMKTTLQPGEKFIAFKRIEIANTIGGRLEYEFVSNLETGGQIKVRMVQYLFFIGDKAYYLQCSVYSDKVPEDLSAEAKRFYPFFDAVAASTVIKQAG